MNNLEIVITRKAQTDIRNIKSYIAKDDKNAAVECVKRLRKAFINLSAYPKLGKNRPEFSGNSDVLFLPVMTKYLVVYSVIADKLYVVRVLSNHQNICALL